jgi:hypothetical protein
MKNYQDSQIGSHATQTKLSDTEAVATFYDDAKVIVPALIKELAIQRKLLIKYIAKALQDINTESEDEIFRYFWRRWLSLNEGEELIIIERKLARLRRLQNIIDGKPAPKGMLPDDIVEAARAVPITDIIGEPVRRNLCLCVLHEDHSPSMRVYTEQNRAWCYVCDNGGDSIQLYMLITGSDFKTAVKELAGVTS